MLREATQRLGIVCLAGATLWLVGSVLWHVSWSALHPGSTYPVFGVSDAITATAITVSVALYFYIRARPRDPEFILNLGLSFMVFTSVCLALVTHIGVPLSDPIGPNVSWTGAVMLMFAAITPSRPRNMLIAALIAASMNPLIMAALRMSASTPGDALEAGFMMHYADFMLAGLAYLISSVVNRLGRKVTQARELGSYKLGELISRGGMGEIYKASHHMLARPAAIKLIRSDVLGSDEGESDGLAVKRFRREAEAAAGLSSPHTVALYDFGITEDRTLYFVMEFLEGKDLEAIVRAGGPLPPRRVIHILCQVCASLAEAHQQGLVHRDIKPANIHLGRAGTEHDFVKVLDFGLVKSVAGEGVDTSLETGSGTTPGTPAYMAPEMSLGTPVDGRADIYALGCVGYFLLTGKRVFDATSAFQMLAMHLRHAPVPPSMRSGKSLPIELEAVILKCLAKKPEERYSTVRELAGALRAVKLDAWTDAEAEECWDGEINSSVLQVSD